MATYIALMNFTEQGLRSVKDTTKRAAAAKEAEAKAAAAAKAGKPVKYTCPMDPEIVQDAPGTCPICGMLPI